jgi:cysteine-rich repeat protein
MRKRIALGVVAMGLLVACGPAGVDLEGGAVDGVRDGTDRPTGVGGAHATAGTCGDDVSVCGDGIVQYPEECDDPRGFEGDCAPDCRIRTNSTGGYPAGGRDGGSDQFCGDGVIQYPEECDDPRGFEGDCAPDCRIRTNGTGGYPAGGRDGGSDQFCGDGVVQYPEQCDDPRGLDGACAPDCRIRTSGGGATGGTDGYPAGGRGGGSDQFCGDGVIQYPEECDDPRGLEGDCAPDCRIRSAGGGTGGTGRVDEPR